MKLIKVLTHYYFMTYILVLSKVLLNRGLALTKLHEQIKGLLNLLNNSQKFSFTNSEHIVMRMSVYNEVIYQILTYIRFFVSHDTDVQILILSIKTSKSAKRNSTCRNIDFNPYTVFSLIIFYNLNKGITLGTNLAMGVKLLYTSFSSGGKLYYIATI